MTTIVALPTCRSCTHWVSDQDSTPVGCCSNPASPFAFEIVTRNLCCSEHDPQSPDHVLIERECVRCGHVNLYAAGYGGEAWCALCD